MAPSYLSREIYVTDSRLRETTTVSADESALGRSPYVLPLGEREPIQRVITNEADYRAFQTEIRRRFRWSVDFQSHDVLGVVYSANASCGVGALYELLAHPADGSAVLSVDIFDGSLGGGATCATLGSAAVIVEVSKSARPQVCVTMFGLP